MLGAEPPLTPGERLPSEIRLLTLPSAINAFTIEGLAANADTFVRVLVRTSGTRIAGNTHARTLGGPRDALDTPLREAHLVAPNALQLVFKNKRVQSFTAFNDWCDLGVDEVIGDTGALLHSGPWSITRANGAAIPIQAVHRRAHRTSLSLTHHD